MKTRKKSMDVREEGIYPPNDFDDKPAFRTAIPIRVRNNGQNPLVDITTPLPKFHPPGRPPRMRDVGLEGSRMPRRAVPDDAEIFRGCGKIPRDQELFGRGRGPRAPRVGKPRRY